MASPAIADASSIGRMGLSVNFSHGVNGALALASAAAVSDSMIAKPPVPSAYP